MAEDNLKVYYHYDRDDKNRPMITQCLLIDEEHQCFAKGIAFCSLTENPRKEYGRMLAYGRAIKAYNKGMCFLTSNGEISEVSIIRYDYKRTQLFVAGYFNSLYAKLIQTFGDQDQKIIFRHRYVL